MDANEEVPGSIDSKKFVLPQATQDDADQVVVRQCISSLLTKPHGQLAVGTTNKVRGWPESSAPLVPA
jgi:hypothetical protein